MGGNCASGMYFITTVTLHMLLSFAIILTLQYKATNISKLHLTAHDYRITVLEMNINTNAPASQIRFY